MRVKMVERALWSQMPKVPEARLMLSVISTAIIDANLGTRGEKTAARIYLDGEISAAKVCGVDPDWVRTVMMRLGLWPVEVESE